MKIYLVTDCAAEENYTPRAFNSYDKAKEYFYSVVNDCICDAEYIDHYEVNKDNAYIVYIDDTYDVIDIFEVEVK